jgi:hypothetical protein
VYGNIGQVLFKFDNVKRIYEEVEESWKYNQPI